VNSSLPLAERLACWSAQQTFEQLPSEVVHEVKRRVIDSLGCALGAWDSDTARVAREFALASPQANGATVFGTAQRSAPDAAAFANGAMVRYLDFNDTYLSKEPAHPSDNISTCLAVAESEGRSGRDLILAIAIAYEVQCRLCDACSIRALGWDHVTYGSYSATLACAKLMNLSVEQTVHALGIAGTTGNYLRQSRAGELSMWKGAAFAAAARNAVFATQLARLGMTGPAPIFEGQFGFFNEVSGPFELPPLAGEDPSRRWMILDTYIKKWPVEYHAQSAVDAALELRKELTDKGLTEQEIRDQVVVLVDTYSPAYVEIRTFDACADIIADPPKWNPTTRESADHSLPYCVAAALLDGDVTLETFDEARLADPQLRALMQVIRVNRDDECNAGYPAGIPNEVEITLSDGATLRRRVDFPRGHARNPMSDEEVEAKFRQLATRWMSEARIAEALEGLWHLDEIERVSAVLAFFVEITKVG